MRFVALLLPVMLFADWAEEVLAKMTLDQKVGQLFMAPACPLRGDDHWADWQRLLKEYHVGNAIMKQSDPVSQVQFLNRLQAESELPLLIAADAEWGLAMRMSDTIAFPRNMTLGAVHDLSLIEQLGEEIGRQAKWVGVHMNLAPVADVNSNPNNPIIHMRSFGEDPARVAERVLAFAKGLQAEGTMACVKHFPGHGDTATDSHRDLPVIAHSRERLDRVELVPFKKAIEGGIDAIMTAHLYVPSVDGVYPTTLSATCMRGMAREELGFQGLIISDALNMKAIADRYGAEEIAFLARKAGCDLLLYGDHINPKVDDIMQNLIPRGFAALKKAYTSGELDERDLDESVLRILRAKEGLVRTVSLDDLSQKLHTLEAIALKRRLFQEAVTLIGEDVFPIPEKCAYWSLGENDLLAAEFGDDSACTVIAVHQKEALTDEVIEQIEAMGDRAILCFFASPYALKSFTKIKTILLAYENDPDAQRAVLQILQGNEKAKGRLPVTIGTP